MTYKTYLHLAIPFTLSTITQPLLGAVDTAVIGRLGAASYIGGVAIGAVIFNTLYWVFGFLRVSTSGFSAQSLGTQKEQDRYYAYFRPLLIALAIGSLLVLFQSKLKSTAMLLYRPEPDVLSQAIIYFDILIWGAPLVLMSYVNLGWLMGRKHVKESLFLQISVNVLNIILDVLFVTVFKLGVAGVAYATLIAQAYGFALGFFLLSRQMTLLNIRTYRDNLFDTTALKKIMGVNADLMIRTVCLLIMTNMFVAKGSELGTDFLAANAVLFQLQYIIAYFYDGFGNASSVFVGKCVGEKNLTEYRRVLRISGVCTAILSMVISLFVLLFHHSLITAFTNLPHVIALCREYAPWVAIFPLVIGIGLVYYGVFTGATYTAPVRNSMLISLLLFIVAYFAMIPRFQNHGLWLAFILFSLGRSLTLFLERNRLIAERF